MPTAVITGGSRGIGRATAIAFAKSGYNIAICGRKKSDLAEAKKCPESLGIQALAIECDVSKSADVLKFSIAVKKKFGHVDVLVNNAGVAHCNEFFAIGRG